MDIQLITLGLVIVALGISICAMWFNRKPPKEEIVYDVDDVPNPGGCRRNDHVWKKQPQLVSDDQQIFICQKGCGSQLRHKFK